MLGGITLNDPEYKNGDNQPQLEAFTIFKHVSRVTRGMVNQFVLRPKHTHAMAAMVEIAIVKRSGAQVKHGMELYVHNQYHIKVVLTPT